MKKILLATDLGSNSDRAMERGLKLAKETGAQLHIVHVLPSYKEKKLVSGLKEDTEDMIKAYIYDYKDSENMDIVIKALQGGEFYARILNYARKIKADLVVMGMHGKKKFRDLFMGTTLERIVRKGPYPVLMVKDKPLGPYQSILSGVDLAPASRNALRLAMEIVPHGAFEVLHTYQVPIAYPTTAEFALPLYDQTEKTHQKMMKDFIKTEMIHFKKGQGNASKRLTGKVMEGVPSALLVSEAKKIKADLLTIGAHGRVGVMPGKLGGTAYDILIDPPCDVLVVRDV